MFDTLNRAALKALSDEELITALTAATRAEAATAARRLALVAETTARQCEDEDDISAHQLIDGWAYAKAQVGAACNVNAFGASKQMRIAQALRERLPRTAAVFADGAVSMTVIDAITWRTKLVTDDDALTLIDAGIAESAPEFGAMTEKGLIEAVDYWVHKFDPCAVIQSKAAARYLHVEFGDREDPDGVVSFWGRMRTTDAKITEARLDELAETVCPNDPRTKRERRADAIATVMAGAARLTCLCGDAECAGSGKDPRSAAVAIYVLTDEVPEAGHGAVPGQGPQLTPGPTGGVPAPDDGPIWGRDDPEDPQPEPKSEPPDAPTAPAASGSPIPAGAGAGICLDGDIIPAHLLADLAVTGATVRPIATAAELTSESRYRPSSKLAAFVRMTSMTCCFPGCGRSAFNCDLDHVIAWPAGATHPGNLRPMCREHHLIKTVCAGWVPVARADGSTTWTAPTGHTYTTRAEVSILFPRNGIRAEIPRKRHIGLIDYADRDSTMPQRQRTRNQDREQRINAERARNALEIGPGGGNDPPY